MTPIKYKQFVFACLIAVNFFMCNTAYAKPLQPELAKTSGDVRLYTLNCGHLDIHNMAPFSDTHSYPRKSMQLAVPCFLIKNPKGWLLWDTGLGDKYANHPFEDTKRGITLTVDNSLVSQLKQLGLTPDDINFVALSHTHFDHTGNANLFPNATWLIQRAEYEYIQQKPLSNAVADHTFTILKPMHKILFKGDYDVFGDKTVQILSTPGHTPGHEVLEIMLPHQGLVILSGDLYHIRKSYLLKQIPVFNTSRPQTLSSMARIDGILNKDHAKLIIQHDPKDFASLPQVPNYLN